LLQRNISEQQGAAHFSTEDNQINPLKPLAHRDCKKKINPPETSALFFFPPHSMFLYFIFKFGFIPLYFAAHITRPVGVLFLFQVTPSRRTPAISVGI